MNIDTLRDYIRSCEAIEFWLSDDKNKTEISKAFYFFSNVDKVYGELCDGVKEYALVDIERSDSDVCLIFRRYYCGFEDTVNIPLSFFVDPSIKNKLITEREIYVMEYNKRQNEIEEEETDKKKQREIELYRELHEKYGKKDS